MQLAEFFVNLGVKGDEDTEKKLKKTKGGIEGLSKISLEAKAAILGAMYALQRLFSESGQRGTNLTNFNATLGVSTKELQQYQYAAQQVGVSNQEVEGSFKNLQSTMTKTLMGEGAPKGLARVAQLTGSISAKDIEEFAREPQKLIQKLQEYAAKETSTPLRNEVLRSFGLGDGMIAGLNRQAFTGDKLARAPTYSEKEISQLDKANVAWSNLGSKVEMAIGRFNARHGESLVKDITKITDSVLKLAEAFMKFSEKAKLFEWLNDIFKGWAGIFDGLTTVIEGVNALFGTTEKDEKKRDRMASDAENIARYSVEVADGFAAQLWGQIKGDYSGKTANAPENQKLLSGFLGTMAKGVSGTGISVGAFGPMGPKAVAPNVPTAGNTSTSNSTQSVTVNQSINVQGNEGDPKRVGREMKRSIQDAFRQLPQNQGN